MSNRRPRHNFQTIAWFWDLYKRDRLDLNPPYQRRSVWNQEFKDYFIDTVLLGNPTAAIFLYEEFSLTGDVTYRLVDGKQRLTTIFEFLDGEFPVGDKALISSLRGKNWEQLDIEVKKNFWAYEFLVEYLPDTEETVINDIFDRINRNVAKLSFQELRHAKYDGDFISSAEKLSKWMTQSDQREPGKLPPGFPNLQERSRRQMKDVEVVAQMLLFLEEGVKSYSQADLDKAFSDRDEAWDSRSNIEDRFRATVSKIAEVVAVGEYDLHKTRLKNQADFYSLFAAMSDPTVNEIPVADIANRLAAFIALVENAETRDQDAVATAYFDAARSASNDVGPRNKRIKIIAAKIRNQEPELE
ncbi:hypothetical protein Pla52o_39160 [Novipirellula galeiformis]|uniref:GmrSD restriction endonucleases N-terminal domain-containing protein n=1 Tax=Novipirellula galeiformis TaxID=2528004 RepID=A0A5C6CG82_9BACT|nr:DUF262 domain-containing protein [Novipirellula galeiformis]TWU21729.1 hypothetical protein Pla52o_39160 [Novipirellula galeiformis]